MKSATRVEGSLPPDAVALTVLTELRHAMVSVDTDAPVWVVPIVGHRVVEVLAQPDNIVRHAAKALLRRARDRGEVMCVRTTFVDPPLFADGVDVTSRLANNAPTSSDGVVLDDMVSLDCVVERLLNSRVLRQRLAQSSTLRVDLNVGTLRFAFLCVGDEHAAFVAPYVRTFCGVRACPIVGIAVDTPAGPWDFFPPPVGSPERVVNDVHTLATHAMEQRQRVEWWVERAESMQREKTRLEEECTALKAWLYRLQRYEAPPDEGVRSTSSRLGTQSAILCRCEKSSRCVVVAEEKYLRDEIAGLFLASGPPLSLPSLQKIDSAWAAVDELRAMAHSIVSRTRGLRDSGSSQGWARLTRQRLEGLTRLQRQSVGEEIVAALSVRCAMVGNDVWGSLATAVDELRRARDESRLLQQHGAFHGLDGTCTFSL